MLRAFPVRAIRTTEDQQLREAGMAFGADYGKEIYEGEEEVFLFTIPAGSGEAIDRRDIVEILPGTLRLACRRIAIVDV